MINLKMQKIINLKLEWFEGTWSRYKPERGKDKRGVNRIRFENFK